MRVLLVDTDESVSVHDEPTTEAILKMVGALLGESDAANSNVSSIAGTTYLNIANQDGESVVTFAGIIMTPADLPLEEAILHLCQTAEVSEAHGNRFAPPAILAPYLV